MLSILALFSITACGDDSSSSSTPDASEERDGDPGSPPDASRPVDAGERPDADPKAPDGGTGRVCGGLAGEECNDSEFCDYPDNMCGNADGAGTCKPRPEACLPVIDNVCGCDGQTHDTECHANQAGTDIAGTGPC